MTRYGRQGGITPAAQRSARIYDPYRPVQTFITQSMVFNGSTQYIDLGAIAALNSQSKLTISLWFAFALTGWTSSSRALLTRNTSAQRQFAITALARGALGELQIGFSSGTTMVVAYVPDNTCSGPWFHHLVVTFDAGTVKCYIDTVEITLQNASGSFPAAVGTSTATVKLGAVGATPSQFWSGWMSNCAMWAGYAATKDHVKTLWGLGRGAVDYRTFPGTIPTPTWYVSGTATPLTELISGAIVAGTNPTFSATKLPPVYIFEDTMFSYRQVINQGDEPWFGSLKYSATPRIQRVSPTRCVWSYSRGAAHIQDHLGHIAFSEDGGYSFGSSGSAWPLDPAGQKEQSIPHGNLSGVESSKRAMTISYIPEIGSEGRLFVVHNEGEYDVPGWAVTNAVVQSNVVTLTAPGHGLITGDWLHTTGLTTNVGDEAHPVVCTVVDANTLTVPLTAANGQMADHSGSVFKDNPIRRTWVSYCDNVLSATTAADLVWATWYEYLDGSVQSASSIGCSNGTSRIIRRPDGKLLFGYYRSSFQANAGIFDAVLAASDDNGVTWHFHATIAHSANRSSGAQFEEPVLGYVVESGSRVLRCHIRVDSGADPDIEGGAALNGVILVTRSTDNGDTWPIPVKAHDGRHQPMWVRRESDGLWVEVYGDQTSPFPPRVRVSDDGIHWSDAQIMVNPWTARSMQGELFITDDGRIACLWAEEMDSGNTRMTFNIFREMWLRDVKIP